MTDRLAAGPSWRLQHCLLRLAASAAMAQLDECEAETFCAPNCTDAPMFCNTLCYSHTRVGCMSLQRKQGFDGHRRAAAACAQRNRDTVSGLLE